MGKLTVKTLNALCKGKSPGLTNDGDGLYFKVTKTGRASWILRYRNNGRPRDMGLGPYPAISLAEAREQTIELRKQIAQGLDPLQAREEEKLKEEEAKQQAIALATTFKAAALDYIEAHQSGWRNEKHAMQWRNSLYTYAYPVIGDLPTSEISTDHLLQILKPIWGTKTETASRVRNRIELVLDAAKARGLRSGENPARWRGHLDKLLPKPSKIAPIKRHAAMPWKNLPAFYKELTQIQGMSARALELTILTASRSGEVINAVWDEVDLDQAIWTIPASRMKAHREHRIPLSPTALALLQALPRISGNPHLFPGQREGRPISGMAMSMLIRRMKVEHVTVHGFRSTFRDWAAECTHHSREACEMSLAHKVAEGAEAAYWRGDLFDKRAELMNDWSAYITN